MISREGGHPWPADIGKAARIGLPGRFLELAEPQSEADPNALLVQHLTIFGNCVGRNVKVAVGRRPPQPLNLFAGVVGETSRGRKGTSYYEALRPFEVGDPLWVCNGVFSGLSTGEGLIKALNDRELVISMLRDARRRSEVDEEALPNCFREIELAESGRRGGSVAPPLHDPDEDGVRFLAYAPEFGRVLRQNQRGGNTLAAVLRELFDSGRAQVLTRKSPLIVHNAHVSLIGHCTPVELSSLITAVDLASGYVNRILWCCSRMRRSEPFGQEPGDEELDLAHEIREALQWGQELAEPLRLTDSGKELWEVLYRREDEEERPEVVARGQVMMLRIAGSYATMGRTAGVTAQHLGAAEEVWRYCRESALHLLVSPGTGASEPFTKLERKILKLIVEAPAGLTRAELWDLTHRNYPAVDLQAALDTLVQRGCLEVAPTDDPRRPRWRLPPDPDIR